ncbi:Na(+)-translocating NADH-quinone reductase subunit C [Shewanella sp. A3A]|uniref:Na(+)-translocating NADH-quinone reductase subunit C n=1 Tax=Shewanella electrica TaxID=515560 RepID=A0ABT2FFN6_9GAMM|nr:Na(+)-translocating NADH-quinone reductase subunit C [Shewanella electrica]MCH1918565.1 Na(+)-translocating NADH-quinone reductase subunit C [Shewanella ferrihydritica]MCH1925283.1 Na(+)-translocating NADH-quinone reductase subunit C [Shewanella electrica]MCS4555108.1 Na(+)-translocating NADH-quinone reductase subunit C [Shewanella electrica]
MAKNKESFARTLFIVVGLCLICSIFVSTAAVLLKPTQQENKLLDKQKYILEAANLIDSKSQVTKQEILDTYEKFVEAKVINLKTGDEVTGVNADTFDQQKASRDPETSSVPEHDIASIKRVADNAVVYLVHDEAGKVTSVILPVHGYGLWSTMYAFLAVEPDLNTVQNLVYYSQGETPGLGGEVENPVWKAKWKGKKLFDEQGNVAISVTKNPAIAETPYGVDALSGATLTSNGVQHSLTFWLGEEGFANFIKKARNGGLS